MQLGMMGQHTKQTSPIKSTSESCNYASIPIVVPYHSIRIWGVKGRNSTASSSIVYTEHSTEMENH